MNARNGADKVRVGDVGERIQVRLVAARGRDAAARAVPLPQLFRFRRRRRVAAVDDGRAVGLEGPGGPERGLAVPVVRRRLHRLAGGWIAGHGRGVADDVVWELVGDAVARRRRRSREGGFLDKGHGGGEDGPALLAGLHGARGVGAAVADFFDVEEHGDLGGAGEDEVAVARVHGEVVGDCFLPGGETHCDHGASIDAARAGRMPERSFVGEDVLGLYC